MKYSDMRYEVEKELEKGNTERAEILAMMMVSDRLDSICEIISTNRSRW